MVIKDEKIVALVNEQTDYFLNNGSEEQKIDVLKRIVKRQKQLMKQKD